MTETKVNLIMLLPGRTMMSEQECSRKTRKPLLDKHGKPVAGKNGKEIWVNAVEYDPSKCDKFIIETKKDPKSGETVKHSVFTRGSKPAAKIINIGKPSYMYFISAEMPDGFKPPKCEKVSPRTCWAKMNKTERLEWHLNDICLSMEGFLLSYSIFVD